MNEEQKLNKSTKKAWYIADVKTYTKLNKRN